MGYQIVKHLREENGDIVCSMCSSNVSPRHFYEWREPKTSKTLAMVRKFIIEREWQPTRKDTEFIRSLNITHYGNGDLFND